LKRKKSAAYQGRLYLASETVVKQLRVIHSPSQKSTSEEGARLNFFENFRFQIP